MPGGGGVDSREPGSALRLLEVPSDHLETATAIALGPPRWSPVGVRRAMDGAELAGQILYTWLTLVLGLILLPSAFGVSLGISEIYMKILVKTVEVSPWRDAAPPPRRALGWGEPGAMENEVRTESRGDARRQGGRSVVWREVRFSLSSAVSRRLPQSWRAPETTGPPCCCGWR